MQMNEQVKQYGHLLNSTLTATERTLCCILETFQTEDGVKVPEVLQPFMMGMDFIPFVNDPPKPAKEEKKTKGKKEEGKPVQPATPPSS